MGPISTRDITALSGEPRLGVSDAPTYGRAYDTASHPLLLQRTETGITDAIE